jgi:hypothetical protein
MKNTMTMTEIRQHFNLRNRREATKQTTDKVLVSCCGCGCEQHISHDDASEWEGTLFGVDAWMCWECE